MDPAVGFIGGGLEVRPIRNSQLVTVSFTDRDPQLAADIANAVAEAYIQFKMNARYDTTGKAKEFLAKDVARVQAEISELQRQLQEYGVENEILGLSDGARDISEQALADLNERYTEAKSQLATAEARNISVHSAPPEALSEVVNSPLIAHLRQEQAELQRRHSQMAERFNDEWPPLQQLEEELAQVRRQLDDETESMAGRIRAIAAADYERAERNLANFEEQYEQQKREVQRVNLVAIEHANLKSQIETKRKVLSDLVARKNQTEASFRLKDTQTSNIRVVDRAATPKFPIRPRKAFNLMLSIIIGSGAGMLLALFLDHLDNTVKSEADIQRVTELAVLGHVPLTRSLKLVGEESEKKEEPTLTAQLDFASQADPRSNFSEAFRNLRTSILLATPDHPPRHIAITSCGPGEGKSTVALNLAIVLTQLGRRVLLVDADLRRPRLHETMRVSNKEGLSNFLSGNVTLESLVQETGVPELKIIISGPIPPNPSELLGSPRLQALLDRFQQEDQFDHIIFDSPPLLSVTDAAILSSLVDSTIIVIRSGDTSREELAQSDLKLKRSHANVIGAVLNAVSEESGYYYGRYRRYLYARRYYGSQPGSSDQPSSPEPPSRKAV
jgi:capsular exopolysaccharide synthesis family protein